MDLVLNKRGESDLIILGRTDKLDTHLRAIDPTHGGKWDIHWTGLVRKKQAELHVIAYV
ncbi:MAG TPA: hypothetical protein VF732_06380 [Nitrospira sp.]